MVVVSHVCWTTWETAEQLVKLDESQAKILTLMGARLYEEIATGKKVFVAKKLKIKGYTRESTNTRKK